LVETYNGIKLPNLMYGTAWKKSTTADLVEAAVGAGFRAIDTANQLKHYDEALVGEGVKRAAKRGVTREQLFLQTKFTSLDGQDHRLPYDAKAAPAEQVRQSFESSLGHFETNFIDSFVLHGPDAFGSNRLTAFDWDVWGAMEAIFAEGRTKALGVSNFTAPQLKALLEKTNVKPMFVQNRCYAAMGWDAQVRAICREHGIIYQGFSLLTANQREISGATVRGIASRLGATLPQVIFKFAIQVGMLPLTGTTDPEHMQQDLACEQFTLSDADVHAIEHVALRV
jgi:diketogulonate reductase-like aldo/keto reductase